MVKSLRRLIFRTLLATIYENFCSVALEKILGAPLPGTISAVQCGGGGGGVEG